MSDNVFKNLVFEKNFLFSTQGMNIFLTKQSFRVKFPFMLNWAVRSVSLYDNPLFVVGPQSQKQHLLDNYRIDFSPKLEGMILG